MDKEPRQESRAQQQVLPDHAPRTFSDLVAQISIIRPGPLQGGMVHPYLRRRRGEEAVRYAHPLLEPVLRDTLGVILYQEQVLEVATALAGFTLGEGDELRRAMGSKRSPERMAALEERFLAGAAGKGVEGAIAAVVFRQIACSGYFPRPRCFLALKAPYAETTGADEESSQNGDRGREHRLAGWCILRLRKHPAYRHPASLVAGGCSRQLSDSLPAGDTLAGGQGHGACGDAA